MISSAFAVIPMGQAIYSTGILRGIVYILRCKCNFRNNAFVLFLIICYLSSLHAGLWDYRIFVFTGLFLFITPIFTSKRIFIFRLKYIVYSLYMFPIVALISLYCYFKGINMMSLVEGDVSWDFSALFWHSMWLGAANGLSNIVLLWMIYKSSNKVWQVILILWLLCSIFLSVVSGSRSALFASLIAMSYLIYLKTINFKKLIQYIIIIGSILFVTIPFYYNYADRMVAKMEYQKENGETSRDEAFAMRVRDFKDSPIIGVGFAVGHHLETGKKEIGRMESGSGWLSVLSQTGILGSLVVIYVLFFAYKSVRKRIKTDLLLQLIVPVILFICVHSVFEGYILTAGYYMCIFFWGILGLLSVYPMYAKIKRPYK
jgi:O-Antigen ligase.